MIGKHMLTFVDSRSTVFVLYTFICVKNVLASQFLESHTCNHAILRVKNPEPKFNRIFFIHILAWPAPSGG